MVPFSKPAASLALFDRTEMTVLYSPAAPSPGSHASKGVTSLRQHKTPWRNWLAPIISVGVLVAALSQLRSLDLHEAVALVPSKATFWLAFAGAYLTLPVSEWIIYRRLWGLPFSGILPLMRKRISNEILLGYSGEIYFYAWARRHAGIVTAPFGAIKDVAILSAQAGNIATLVLIGLAWPTLGELHLGVHSRELLLSVLGIMLLSLPPLLLRRHVLSLPRADLWKIGAIHIARIAVTLLLTALLWHEALPSVAMSWWLVLSALRQLLTRLPMVPNKDIVFAGVVAYLIGPHEGLVAMVAMTASLTVVAHIVLGALLATTDLAFPELTNPRND